MANVSMTIRAGAAALVWAAAAGANAAVVTLTAIDASYTNRAPVGTGPFVASNFTNGRVGPDDRTGLQGFTPAEARYALQFNLGSLPTGATITNASLRLRDSQGNDDVFAYGFVGDGTFSAASVTAGTQLFRLSGAFTPVTYDVTDFVDDLDSSDWAGFSFRQLPLDTTGISYGFLEGPRNLNAPQLTVTFVTPAADVPEPGSLALAATALVGIAAAQRRRGRQPRPEDNESRSAS